MKSDIDIGLAVLCSEDFRREHGHVGRFDIMAEACGCSAERMRVICNGALDKMRVRLAERGVSRIEALMLLEVLEQGDSYKAQKFPADSESVSVTHHIT